MIYDDTSESEPEVGATPETIDKELRLNAPAPLDSERRRMVAVLAFAESRSIMFAARASGLHFKTVESIIKSPEAEIEIEAARAAIRMGLASGYMDLQIAAQRECLDRLRNGDEVITKFGLVRVRMKGRDAATIFKLAGDRHDILTGNIAPTSANDPKLIALAGQLMQVAEARQIELTERAPLPSRDSGTVSVATIAEALAESDPESIGDVLQMSTSPHKHVQ